MEPNSPLVAFLGVCDQSMFQSLQGAPDVQKLDLIGLAKIVPYPFFPISFHKFEFVFAVSDQSLLNGSTIRLTFPDGVQFMDFKPEVGKSLVGGSSPDPSSNGLPNWTWLIWAPADLPGHIAHQGRYRISFRYGGTEETIGCLELKHHPPLPLTADRRQAILSNPSALQHARVSIACNSCGDSVKIYTALDRYPPYEKTGYIWYEDLPEEFRCGCGKTQEDLTLLRQHFHAVLGGLPDSCGKIFFTKLYQRNAIEAVCSSFAALLNQMPPEEEVQKFIQDNPVLLSCFSPKRVFYKAPILARYRTDIVILNHKKELLLIELERPGMKILRKDGGHTAEIGKPLKQVRDWLHLGEEHRAAMLACIENLTLADVSRIRGVVVAGRDSDNDSEHLRHHKWTDFGSNVSVLTYDDLIGAVVSLARTMSNL